ncbi:hypothetical protein CDV31_000935 [Fusarium ambrosium]|uniref:NAD(P)-binding domain-containing protein n=1 Tax=Fusarium ambrosium TaxID=131363 RepID=A0A428V0U2_9HYPO|nr:hypothetical protein CDV31_000935 [Fusarium ambrosium]
MAPSILLTGATGYTGGTVLNTLVTAHPEYDITVLLRKPTKSFLEKYPGVTVLQADFDSTELLREAASKADIVVHHGNSDHVPAVKALITGVTERAQASEPAFYIHLGGTGIIAESTNVGELHPKVWSDIDDIDAIWSFPIEAIHRDTELLIQDAWTKYGDKLKTAVVCPPNIHGKGTGPDRTESFYVPYFYAESLKLGSTFYVGSGSNVYSRVHVEDVAQVFLKLVEAAVDGGKGAEWGREGYYFTASEEVSQFEIAVAVGKILKSKGQLETEEPKQISLHELDSLLAEIPVKGAARLVFGSNSRSKPDRARKLLGYKPRGRSFLDSLEDDLISAMELLKRRKLYMRSLKNIAAAMGFDLSKAMILT